MTEPTTEQTSTSEPPARLAPGDEAPDFTLPDATGQPVRLADLTADGRRAVLFFYPAALTPGCTKEACGFRDSLSDFRAAGYEVVGISPDAPAKLARFADAEGLTYPLLSDPSKETLTAYGAFGTKSTYGKQVQGVIRSTVVVDADGRIQQALYDIKATGHVDRLRRELGLR